MLIDRFVASVAAGLSSWYEAGTILVEIKQSIQDGFSQIMKKAPWITPDMLHSFLAMGQKRLYPPALLVSNGRVGNKILEMPYEAQEKACNHPFDVARLTKTGKTVMKKTLSDITPDEADLAFCKTGIRSVAEQLRVQNDSRKRKEPTPTKEWIDLGRKISPVGLIPSAIHSPVGLYAVRQNQVGQIVFEKTTARPMTTQRVILTGGVAVIEIVIPKATPAL